MLSGIIFSVIIHSDVQIFAILLSAILLSVILVNIILSNVVAAECFLNSDRYTHFFFQFKTKLRLSC